MNAALQGAEKLKTPSFRGMLFAEESLFSWVSIEEGFLASLGMTENGTFSAACLAAGALELQFPPTLRGHAQQRMPPQLSELRYYPIPLICRESPSLLD
jgi:hypothetical protein